jgi:hypothetical protein
MNGEAATEAVETRRFPVYGEAVPKGLKRCLLSFTETWLGDRRASPKRV